MNILSKMAIVFLLPTTVLIVSLSRASEDPSICGSKALQSEIIAKLKNTITEQKGKGLGVWQYKLLKKKVHRFTLSQRGGPKYDVLFVDPEQEVLAGFKVSINHDVSFSIVFETGRYKYHDTDSDGMVDSFNRLYWQRGSQETPEYQAQRQFCNALENIKRTFN